MELDRAQLSSLATSLTDLLDRIRSMAEGYADSPREDVAADLFEVERSLQVAARRFQSLLDKAT
jgi:hypothetical protein